MPVNSIQVFDMKSREWQRQCLRGGRCEPFKLYWKAQYEHEEIKIYDVNSEYPAAQMYGYAPWGAMTVEKSYVEARPILSVAREMYKEHKFNLIDLLLDPTGQSGMGLIECVIESAFSPFPILPFRTKTKSTYFKNLFMVKDGTWCGWMTVLAEAIRHRQVIVTYIKRIQIWKQTSNTIFRSFLSKIYAAKVEATSWEKNLGYNGATDLERRQFVKDCNARGIPVLYDRMGDNPGKRTTAKTEANCGWGYLCQKPHATDILYFNNEVEEEVDEMFDTLEQLQSDKDPRRLMGIPTGIGKYTRVKVTKEPLDITTKEMNSNIAYQTGGCAPAWGLQLLSRTILTLHPAQPVYCDTDSIFMIHDSEKVKTGIYKEIKTGQFLGDFIDEYPEYRIVEFVCIGPKSYFMKMIHRTSKKIEYKGKFKGLPSQSASFSLLNEKEELAAFGMEQMKQILFSSLEEDQLEEFIMKFHYTNFFKRGADLKIREQKETKSIRFTFDKRKVNLPRCDHSDKITEISTTPIVEGETTHTPEDVEVWWQNVQEKVCI